MSGILSIGLSGMQAAETRLSIAAGNIANMNSAGHTAKGAAEAGASAHQPFQPSAAVATATLDGGVTVTAVPVDPATVSVYSPSNLLADSGGMIAMPNLSFAEQMVEMKIATISYTASAKIIGAESDLTGALLDSLS